MVYDARYNTKVFLTDAAKGIQNANITKDDDITLASWIVYFSDPPYPIERVFKGTKNVDLGFGLCMPTSIPRFGGSFTPCGYLEEVPTDIQCIKKQGIDANKILWKGVAELRRIMENNPTGSLRTLGRMTDIGTASSTKIHGVRVIISYERGIT